MDAARELRRLGAFATNRIDRILGAILVCRLLTASAARSYKAEGRECESATDDRCLLSTTVYSQYVKQHFNAACCMCRAAVVDSDTVCDHC